MTETSRRVVLRWVVAGTLGVALPGVTAAVAARLPRRAAAPAAGGPPPEMFTRPLPVPAVLKPIDTANGVDRYEIRQAPGSQRILADFDTPILGYNGTFPGPTIEARSGRQVVVTHRNELTVPTVVHLHGGVVAPEHNGYPVDFVAPGPPSMDLIEHAQHGVAGIATGLREYVYPNQQAAATLWYHDHRMGFSGPQQYQGLAGFYLLRDDIEDALPLPGGERDLPLMIADRSFVDDGSLFYPWKDPEHREPGVTVKYHHSGMIGDTITVNGVAWPVREVDAALHRLRLLNASNARAYRLALDPQPPGGGGFIQIGSDVGLLPKPVRQDDIVISPGERYDVLVDFAQYAPGTRVTLRNTGSDGKATGNDSYVLRFIVTRKVRDDARVPETLTTAPAPPPRVDGSADRRFGFFIGPEGVEGPPMINGQLWEATRIDAAPVAGAQELWDFNADATHPVHLHGAHFRIVSRNGGAPAAQDGGWKDTVFLPAGSTRLAVSFPQYRGKYLVHCHNLEHGDAGMMANVNIV